MLYPLFKHDHIIHTAMGHSLEGILVTITCFGGFMLYIGTPVNFINFINKDPNTLAPACPVCLCSHNLAEANGFLHA